MITRSASVLAMICLAAFGIRAEEAGEQTQEFQRVFVFDAASKPAAAMTTGHYEWRKFDNGGLYAMMCKECLARVPSSQIATMPTAFIDEKNAGIAYLCPQCGNLVWKVNGIETPLTGERGRLSQKDLLAIVQIAADLRKPHELALNPGVQADQKSR